MKVENTASVRGTGSAKNELFARIPVRKEAKLVLEPKILTP